MSAGKTSDTMNSERGDSPRPYRRARSDAQKRERRHDILAAARDHLTDVGVDGFSMGALTAAVGVARATLYLYFPTREEVLLTLYLDEMRAWIDELAQLTEPDMAVDEFLRVLYSSATRREILMELAPRVTGEIEGNVSIEHLIESKRQGARIVVLAGRRAALALGRTEDEGAAIARALFALLLGITQSMKTPHFDEAAALPADVRQMLGANDAHETFVRVGRWLVDGSHLDNTLR